MKAPVTRLCALFALVGTISCSNGVALGPPSASDLASNPTAPSAVTNPTSAMPTPTPAPTPAPAPTSTPVQKLAYSPDLESIFSSDCTPCHSGNRPSGNYSMTSYSGVMRAVRAGSASSALVIVTRSNGSMYRFFSGDRAAKAAMISEWVVTDGAPASR